MAKKKSSKTRKIVVFSIIVIAIAGMTAAALMRNKTVYITVQTEEVKPRDLTETVVATGKIQPVTRVIINPEVSGEIIELPVNEGDAVKKGDLLVKLKPDNYIASRNSAEANYKSSLAGLNLAKANLEKAEFEYQRAKELFNNNLISESQYLDAKTSLDVSRATHESSGHQVDQAMAALERAEDDLSKTTIFAPMDGIVSRLNSEVGERVVGTAMMAGTEIMTIADLSAMEAWVDIGEVDVVLIENGQRAQLDVDAFRDEAFTGQVTEIANSAKSSGAGTQAEATKFEIKIRIKEQAAFRPGMSVTAEIETRYRTNVLTVPIQSVTTRMPKPGTPDTGSTSEANGTNESPATSNASSRPAANKPIEVVFIADSGKAKMIPVERGISDDNYTEIISGVEEGMKVISGGFTAINRELEDGKDIQEGPLFGSLEEENAP